MDENEALLALNERRAARALDKAPALVGYMRHLVTPGGAAQDGTPRAPKADPPLPFRADAVDDADALYSELVNRVDGWMRFLPVLPPEVRTWRPDGGDVAGFPSGTTPAGAEVLTWLVCRWLMRHHQQFVALQAVLGLPVADHYFADVADAVGRMRGRYPMAPQPPRRALRRECPVCKERAVVARIPQDVRDTEVVCEQCGYEIPYDSYAGLVEGWLK